MSYGNYIAKNIVTTENIDLIDELRTATGIPLLTAKKLTLITDGATTISVNGGTASDIYVESGIGRVSFSQEDILVTSLVVADAGITVFIAAVY